MNEIKPKTGNEAESGDDSLNIKWAAACSAFLAGGSVLIAVLVYLNYPHPTGIEHAAAPSFARAATGRVESFESYIFAAPLFQTITFVFLVFAAFKSAAFKETSLSREIRANQKFPSTKNVDSVIASKAALAVFLLMEVLLLVFAIYRAILVVTDNV